VDVSVDLETLGTGPRAVIVSIGAVKFLPTVGGEALSEFYVNVELESCIEAGLTVDSAVYWWLRQSEAAREALIHPAPVPLVVALEEFSDFFGSCECLWGNGSNFDNRLLYSAYHAVGIPYPVHYTRDRDLRTLEWAAKTVSRSTYRRRSRMPGEVHNALDDAEYQAAIIADCFDALR